MQAEARMLKNNRDLEESKYQSAETAKRDAEANLNAACAWAGLAPVKVEPFLKVIDALTAKSVDIEAVGRERLNLRKVLDRKSAVAALISRAEHINTLETSLQEIDREIMKHTEHLGKTAIRRAHVEEAKRFNDALERKRGKAGFWASLWSGITESPNHRRISPRLSRILPMQRGWSVKQRLPCRCCVRD
ncbi:MAG: hypothetical protein ACRYFU_13520 [Janthinobacterium lividum]